MDKNLLKMAKSVERNIKNFQKFQDSLAKVDLSAFNDPPSIPDGVSGNVEVSNFEFSEVESHLHSIRCMFNAGRLAFDAPNPPGRYLRLLVDGEVMMSNTMMERRTNIDFVNRARGDVLIAGLGLGMIVKPILSKVNSVTVIEMNDNVIKLVGPYLKNDKLTIVNSDVLKWHSGKKFDVIYFDIWPTISRDNIEDMEFLHHRFSKNLNDGGWIGSWLYEELKFGNIG